MGDFFKKHDILTKLLSLVCALILWVYVMDETNPIRTEKHDDIVVDLTYKSQLLEDHNLAVISDEFPKVSITLSGAQDSVTKVLPNHIEASASLASITEPGEYELDYTVNLPFLDIDVENKSPAKITVVVDEVVTKSIDVLVDVTGTPQSSYSYNSIYTDEKIIVTGPKTEVSKIKTAYALVDVSGNTENVNEMVTISLLDEENAEVDLDTLDLDKTSVRVVGQILKTKEVPLTVELLYGDVISEDVVLGYEVTEPTVEIIGTPRNIDAIDEISLGEINVDEVLDGKTAFVFAIPTLQGVNYVDVTSSIFKVDLDVGDFSTKELFVNNFTELVVSDEFTGTISIKTPSILISMHGSEEELEKVSSDDIEISAIFIEDELLEGENEVLAEIILNTDADIEIIGQYTVILEVIN